jgi:hypothetical protein
LVGKILDKGAQGALALRGVGDLGDPEELAGGVCPLPSIPSLGIPIPGVPGLCRRPPVPGVNSGFPRGLLVLDLRLGAPERDAIRSSDGDLDAADHSQKAAKRRADHQDPSSLLFTH